MAFRDGDESKPRAEPVDPGSAVAPASSNALGPGAPGPWPVDPVPKSVLRKRNAASHIDSDAMSQSSVGTSVSRAFRCKHTHTHIHTHTHSTHTQHTHTHTAHTAHRAHTDILSLYCLIWQLDNTGYKYRQDVSNGKLSSGSSSARCAGPVLQSECADMVRYCPFQARAALAALLVVAATHHCLPSQVALVMKGNPPAPLSWSRVLGLGLEQCFKYLLAVGSPKKSVPYVAFSGVVSQNASPQGVMGVPLSMPQQRFLCNVANAVWNFFHHCGVGVVGVDVPRDQFEDGNPAESYDIVGVAAEGALLSVMGPCDIEVFLTEGAWQGDAVKGKKRKAAAAAATAASLFVCHLLVVARFKDHGLAKGPAFLDWKIFKLTAELEWEEILQHVIVPSRLLLSEAETRFVGILNDLGKPLASRSKWGPQYALAKFLSACGCTTSPERMAASMKAKGAKGIKKLKVKHGSGGARMKAGGPKVGSVWACNRDGLLEIYKHIALGRL